MAVAFPPRVASGELITSAWGNAVVDTLTFVRHFQQKVSGVVVSGGNVRMCTIALPDDGPCTAFAIAGCSWNHSTGTVINCIAGIAVFPVPGTFTQNGVVTISGMANQGENRDSVVTTTIDITAPTTVALEMLVTTPNSATCWGSATLDVYTFRQPTGALR